MKDNITISQLMEIISKRTPNREVFVFPQTGKRYTFKEFQDKIDETAKALINQGIKKGCHVGIWMDNTEEWFITFFAANQIGAIGVPINPKYGVAEMSYILNKFDIETLFMSNGYQNCHIDIANKLFSDFQIPNSNFPKLKSIITIGFECNKKNISSFETFISKEKNIDNYTMSCLQKNNVGDDTAIILPTSGTTGLSKGVQLTNNQLLKNGYDIGQRYKLDHNDKLLIQVPMVHCFGITLSMLAALTHLTSMSVISSFNSDIALKTIENEKITCINGVPSMYNEIINNPNFSKTDLTSLKKGIMAGSNCYPEFISKISKLMQMKIISVYGLSEASPGCTMSNVLDNKYTRTYTVGSALPGVECKIIDPQSQKEVEIGEKGEFIVRGYNVMTGYYNDIDETNKVIDNQGYLHTGDLAIKIDDNNYRIIGRIKDVIIRGGENIYPAEVSRIIDEIPGIVESVVFGVDDPRLGQEVKVCVTINDQSITPEQIRDYMKMQCAKFKIPKYIQIVPSIIKNNNGKPLIREMKLKYPN